MGLALLVWVGGGLLKRVLYFFGNEPSLGQKSPVLPRSLYEFVYLFSHCNNSACNFLHILFCKAF